MTDFPAGFLWGAATSAYQIEGAVDKDGRGESIWDVFARRPGAVRDGSSGEVADDHYHRHPEDVELMSELGLGAYRFSVAWPRVLPQGRGQVNRRGLDFYSRLVDSLLARSIQPFVTLYHWDLPQALQEEGGWGSRSIVDAFAAYAGAVVDALGDRVRLWSTLNEPWCSAFLGHAAGIHAPGIADAGAAFRAAHHLLLAHGAAARRIRGDGRQVSIALNLFPVHPAGDAAADADAARRVDGLQNRMFLDPIFGRGYPDDVVEAMDRCAGLDHVRDQDLEAIAAPLDALGVNYYHTHVVRAAPEAREPAAFPGVGGVELVRPDATTAMGWGIEPHGLLEVLERLRAELLPVALYVTENGAAFDDRRAGGCVPDPHRTAFLAEHIEACRGALAAGVDLRGYFVWSLLDNFEWAEGYTKRFGIVWVDYATQERLVKDSGRWYAGLIASNGSGGAL